MKSFFLGVILFALALLGGIFYVESWLKAPIESARLPLEFRIERGQTLQNTLESLRESGVAVQTLPMMILGEKTKQHLLRETLTLTFSYRSRVKRNRSPG